MDEKWLQAHIFFTGDKVSNIPDVLKEVIKPCVDTLKSEDLRKTYHYLFEERTDGELGVELLFRIEVKQDIEKIEKIIDERIKEYEHLTNGFKIDYDFELEKHICDFGQDGWELTKQLFEVGSEIAIGTLLQSFRKSRDFNYIKIIHCLLNQQGFPEERLYAIMLIDRAMVEFDVKLINTEVENRVKQILEDEIKKMKSKQK